MLNKLYFCLSLLSTSYKQCFKITGTYHPPFLNPMAFWEITHFIGEILETYLNSTTLFYHFDKFISKIGLIKVFSFEKKNCELVPSIYGTSKKNVIFFSYIEDNIRTNEFFYDENIFQQHKQLYLYAQLDEKKLTILDYNLWISVVWQKGFFYILYDLFEFWDYSPFFYNLKFEEWVYRTITLLNFLDLNDHRATYELASSFYYEPFFFFWKKIDQSLIEFWFVSFFWERALLLDEKIFHPKIHWNDTKHIFPPLSHLSHSSELKFAYWMMKWLHNYKQIHFSAAYLSLTDLQYYAFDKKFIHFWNYWIGAYHPMNIFWYQKLPGFLNFFWEKIFTPKIHIDSTYYWEDKGYKLYSSKILEFAIFPDTALLWGHFNPNFDRMTSGYNWFFHFGNTYMDSNLSLEFLWFQLTYNYHGDFDYLVEDFSAYQPVYFSGDIATVWIPLMLLLSKTYESSGDMNMFINDYNKVFHFKWMKAYQEFVGSVFFPLQPIEWLELLRDPVSVDQRLHNLEWVVNLFFGYNTSDFLANQPKWVIDLTDIYSFYLTTKYDSTEDQKIEELAKKMIYSITGFDYWYTADPSIYFLPKITALSKNLSNMIFFNEKILDDSGYFYTSLNWNTNFFKPTTHVWLKSFSLIHFEYIPAPHYNWNFFVFEKKILDWNQLNFFFQKQIVWDFLIALQNSIKIEFVYNKFCQTQLRGDWIMNGATLAGPETFHISLDILPFIWFFTSYFNKTWFDFYYLFLINLQYCLFNFFYDPFKIIYIGKENFFFICIKQIYYIFSYWFPNILSVENVFMAIEKKLYFLNIFVNFYRNYFENFIKFIFGFDLTYVYIYTQIIPGTRYWISTLQKIEIQTTLLYSFYLPIIPFQFKNFTFVLNKQLTNTFFLFEFPNLQNNSHEKLWELKMFIFYWALYELNCTEYQKFFLHDIIQILNWIDISALTTSSVEYDWYINYILKSKLYKTNK